VTTRLEAETAEQPAVAAALLDAQLPRLDEWRAALHADEIDGVVLVARGSSDNAARYAQYLWSLRTGHPVTLATPSLHTIYGRPLDVSGQAVVAISQSGASPDVVEVLRAAAEQGAPTVAVTNDPSSPLADVAGAVLDLAAGEERSVAATKTYTSSLMAVAVLALALDTSDDQTTHVADLRAVPGAMTAAVEATSGLSEASAVLAKAYRGVVVGRGLNLCTAFETALKVTELTGSLMAPYSPADLLHGPVGAVGPVVPVVLVAPEEPASASVLEAAPEAQRRGAPLVVIASEGTEVDGPVAARIGLPAAAAVADWLTPMVAVVPGQLLARAVAEARGIDVDHPGGLSKVTRTT
jgi:glucosamine--fructose-6-phosphate aminotransferase (isomerizing)